MLAELGQSLRGGERVRSVPPLLIREAAQALDSIGSGVAGFFAYAVYVLVQNAEYEGHYIAAIFIGVALSAILFRLPFECL